MKVLLLTSAIMPMVANPVDESQTFRENLMDWQVRQLLLLKLEPVIVMDKLTGETSLRHSRQLEACDLAFDTTSDPDFASQLRAGLHATHGESFVLPISVPCPPLTVWNVLRAHLYKKAPEDTDLIRPFCPIAGELCPGFPLLITRRGRERIKRNANPLDDPQLRVSRAPVLDSAITRVVNGDPFSSLNQGLDS